MELAKPLELAFVAAGPLEHVPLDPDRGIALKRPDWIEGDHHLRIPVKGVQVHPECAVRQHPNHDSLEHG